MNTMCARLQDANEAGEYRLNCPLNELRAAAVQVKFALFEADLVSVHDKSEFLAAMAKAIHAPNWFGNNWDALADVLSDLSWQPASGYVLLLRNGGESLGLQVTDHAIASQILTDTVDFWKSQGKPFWAFRC